MFRPAYERYRQYYTLLHHSRPEDGPMSGSKHVVVLEQQ